MTASEQLAQFAAGSKALPKLCREYKKERATVHLKELVGGALSFYAAAAVAKTGGVHIFVAEDRDAAAYLLNDFYNLLDEKQVYFFPSSYKRSAAYGAEDAQGVVQRTAAMNAVRGFTKGYLVVCTYPEALAERVVDAATLQRDTIAVKLGDKISIAVLEDALADANFTRVDFVYEPGQYSVRGGIVDVFSYSESKPYRIDFFGDEVETIRTFDVETQLSKEKLDSIYIVPEMSKNAMDSTSLLGSLPRNTCIAAVQGAHRKRMERRSGGSRRGILRRYRPDAEEISPGRGLPTGGLGFPSHSFRGTADGNGGRYHPFLYANAADLS